MISQVSKGTKEKQNNKNQVRRIFKWLHYIFLLYKDYEIDKEKLSDYKYQNKWNITFLVININDRMLKQITPNISI